MENCRLLYAGLLIPEKHEPRIQLKESENPLTVEIRNPLSTDMESGIQYFTAWNPAELRDYHPPMKVPYIGGEKSGIHSLLRVCLDFDFTLVRLALI